MEDFPLDFMFPGKYSIGNNWDRDGLYENSEVHKYIKSVGHGSKIGQKGTEMVVYPIYHSGFFIELKERYLLFDCVKEEIPLLDRDKPLYIFISHSHGDHFSPQIREMTAYYSSRTFISGGVEGENFHVLLPDSRLELEGLVVTTLDSTDDGVAFLVETEGKTIFHAGDLHLWYWDDDTEAERREMYRRYREEIEKLRGRHIDVAFLVLDSRQTEPDALGGIEFFNDITVTDYIFPMHYSDDEALLGERISRLKRSDNVIDTRRQKRYEF